MTTQIINFGCSFAYGNQASSYDVLCGKHRSIATWLAEHYGLSEINLARPGNSNGGIVDTVLNWISTTNEDKLKNSIVLIGWSSGFRYGFVSDKELSSNKSRLKNADNITARDAFLLGPANVYRYHTDRWNSRHHIANINLYETARINLYRNILTMNAVAAQYNLKMYHYHGLDSHWYLENLDNNFLYEINDNIRRIIDINRFYQFEKFSLQQLANSNPKKYHVSSEDSHPNHICYKKWANELCEWIDKIN